MWSYIHRGVWRPQREYKGRRERTSTGPRKAPVSKRWKEQRELGNVAEKKQSEAEERQGGCAITKSKVGEL